MSDKSPSSSSSNIEIGLGDIIQIIAPTNSTINDQVYLIEYIDETKIKLINVATSAQLILTMSAKGGFSDESITSIAILNSPEFPGYARQNKLTTGTWVDIHFGGELPTIITGKITDLEEDMIEIKTYPGEQVFYIDFGYKGIPENIPIEEISIRSPPTETTRVSLAGVAAAAAASTTSSTASIQEEEIGIAPISISKQPRLESISPQVPIEEVKTALKEILLDADSIQFGDELEPIVQMVELPEEQKRYSIEKQTTDLLNELISKFPNIERTKSVLNNIHSIIERFRQLREEFSTFDSNGNATLVKRRSEEYKPLAKTLLALNQKLFWILPVSKNIRKFYNVESSMERSDVTDFTVTSTEESVETENAIADDYSTNKDSFITYITKMNDYITPYTNTDSELGFSQFVHTNITSILDNLTDFYSSIVKGEQIKRNQFVIQTYNLGLSQIQTRKIKSFGKRVADITDVVPLTSDDSINITSFISLPEPVMNFSNISLPNTNIMRRANMGAHFVQYWNLLRKNTSVTRKAISIEERERESQYGIDDMIQFTSSFMSFFADEEIDSEEKYRKFVEMLIPNTTLLFETMNKYITGDITLGNYVAILQPFMIYVRDLTSKQYNLIVSIIEQHVLDYRKKIVQSAKEYAALSTAKYAARYAGVSAVYNLLKDSKQMNFDTDILELYGLSPENYMNVGEKQVNVPGGDALGARGSAGVGGVGGVGGIELESDKLQTTHKRHIPSPSLMKKKSSAVGVGTAGSIFPPITFTNQEILYRLICMDNARLYMNTLSIINEDLITPFDFDQLYAQEKDKFDQEMGSKQEANKCKNFVLTKKYIDKDELEEDQSEEIFYDKQYDFTDYPFLKKHDKERSQYSEDDFNTFLIARYMKKTKLPLKDATSEIQDMIRGKRKVQDGQYAVLEVSDEEGDRYEYYMRSNRHWIKDDTIPASVSMYDTTYFCNVKSDCFALNKKCMTPELAADAMKDEVIKKMYDEFDSNFNQSRKQILDSVYRKYNYSIDTIEKIHSIRKYNAYKYNNSQYLSGLDIDIDPSVKEKLSPYARIFDLILGQTDYVKRQRNIIRFIQKFTRKAVDESTSMTLSIENESPYWLYCKDTNTKLVPSFFETIATVFLNQGDIYTTIDTICKERGSISEDGDAWTDKYSGYVIKNIDMDTEEGYDAAGYKLQTREVMEKTLGESLIQSLQDKKLPTYKNPDAQMISGIITTMTKYMGIDLEVQRAFIVEQVMGVIMTKIPTEEAFNKKKLSAASASASAASKQTYKDFKLNTILLLTLSFMVVIIQINIPSVKTRKTFPGCIRSFMGYPIDGDGDNSSIKYIACIAVKIKSSIEPWNTIKGKKDDDIMSKIKAYIDKIVIKIPTVETKILEKREYNKIHAAEELPAEHDIINWINFLPPLSKIKMSTPQPLSPNFESGLLEDFKKASRSQVEKISAIRSKIIFYSLAIQVMIQRVVDKEKLILTNGANDPFIENACCNSDGSVNTIQYFIEQERVILDYNTQVKRLRDVIDDIVNIQKSSSFLDQSNTRTKYPEIPERFDEQTVYLAFITYCKFNNDIPIPETIQHLCHNKPSTDIYNPSEESLRAKIDKLKSTGEYNYTPEALQALLQIVNHDHIIPFDFNPTEISYIQRMRDLIKSYQERQSPEVSEVLLNKLTGILDTFDIKIAEDTPELQDLKNYLSETNAGMVDTILEFISQYKRLDRQKTALYRSFLLNITNFKLIGDSVLCPKRDTTTYKGMQFVINEMRNLIAVFPNIIMNSVSNQKVSISKHWGLSRQHIMDIQSIVKKYYMDLEKFVKDKDNSILTNVAKGIMKETNEWFQFALNTPLFARVSPMGSSSMVPGEAVDTEIEEMEDEMVMEGEQQDLLAGLFGQPSSKKGKQMSAHEREQREEEGKRRGEGHAASKPSSHRREEPMAEGYYSIFNDDLVRRLFTHYFLNVILKYVKLAKTVVVVTEEAELPPEDESELVSVLEAEDRQNGVVREISIVAQENVELKSMVANLLLMFFKIIMTDKAAINVNKKSVKEDITQSKDKEKDIITREFRDMQIAERQVENITKNLRLGDWNVGATKGLRFYVPETYDQEREEMENEFKRDEERAKLEKRVRKNDKVTERMRDIYADEEEERQHQDALIDAELADDFNLQGDDDEFGNDDDGEFNPRESGEGDD